MCTKCRSGVNGALIAGAPRTGPARVETNRCDGIEKLFQRRFAVTVLEKGSTGQEVTNLQVALNSQLPTVCPPLVVDGIFGPKTKARTIEFQKQYELLVDGIVGPQTH
jgi:hypothetical protein